MPMSCSSFAIHWLYTEIRAPESKLRQKSNISTQTASGVWNYWPHIASLPQLKEEKSKDEISREYGGWSDSVTWNSSNLSMVLVELWHFQSPRWINIRSIPLFPIMAMTAHLVLACFWFIIKRQQSVNVESEHEPWLFRVDFQMCSTRHHISGCDPLR
jgi:hypothetical protein